MTRSRQDIIEDWYERAGIAQKAHQFSADKFDSRGKQIGIPSIVLSGIVGTSLFANPAVTNLSVPSILLSVLSLASAVLAGVQTFMSYPERAEKHRIAAARYGALCRDLDLMRISPNSIDDTRLEACRKDIDALALASPNPPINLYRKAWGKWDEWKQVPTRQPGDHDR